MSLIQEIFNFIFAQPGIVQILLFTQVLILIIFLPRILVLLVQLFIKKKKVKTIELSMTRDQFITSLKNKLFETNINFEKINATKFTLYDIFSTLFILPILPLKLFLLIKNLFYKSKSSTEIDIEKYLRDLSMKGSFHLIFLDNPNREFDFESYFTNSDITKYPLAGKIEDNNISLYLTQKYPNENVYFQQDAKAFLYEIRIKENSDRNLVLELYKEKFWFIRDAFDILYDNYLIVIPKHSTISKLAIQLFILPCFFFYCILQFQA